MQAPFIVEFRSVTKAFGPKVVYESLDLAVLRGETVTVMGGSGTGKSVLLKMLMGLMDADRGEILFDGAPVRTERDFARVRQRVGMLFQGGALLNSLSLHENVALPINEFAPQLPAAVVDEMVRMKLALVGLEHAALLTPPELSGGMRKRAALARAMALDPEVLFCDEPSAGLDPVTAASLDELILSLRDRFDMTVVIVTHELPSIEAIADRVTMLSAGQVLACGALDDVRRDPHPEVQAFFRRQPKTAAERQPSVLGVLAGGQP